MHAQRNGPVSSGPLMPGACSCAHSCTAERLNGLVDGVEDPVFTQGFEESRAFCHLDDRLADVGKGEISKT